MCEKRRLSRLGCRSSAVLAVLCSVAVRTERHRRRRRELYAEGCQHRQARGPHIRDRRLYTMRLINRLEREVELPSHQLGGGDLRDVCHAVAVVVDLIVFLALLLYLLCLPLQVGEIRVRALPAHCSKGLYRGDRRGIRAAKVAESRAEEYQKQILRQQLPEDEGVLHEEGEPRVERHPDAYRRE